MSLEIRDLSINVVIATTSLTNTVITQLQDAGVDNIEYVASIEAAKQSLFPT